MSNVQLDKVHSALNFTVKHMMVSKAKGEFKNFDVDFKGDINNLEEAKVTFSIDVDSIETNNEDRDGHLKSEDFFDVENHPKIVFEGTSVNKVGDSEYEVTGNLTIRGTTNQETFKVDFNGLAKDPMQGNMIAGFDVEGKINREAYGLEWNAALETGGVLIGKDVNFTAGLEFVVEE
ncbi:YceI family protein [Tenuibacillus multivorans]|uniref:Polyisoprenoid-binding protein YceI n=1 Tax=Tenuibacillus multivorans TaxID=237069 RepID=A0A1G9YHH7_9BACI|nr:YceI family protein [Tenuibacillus multivorans]GEL78530.1 UPF0312 protein [Tenuibacillus multivorans]SDN07965.1 Polyisoprenoid-binding protein YceI [Tenuibacillus multivorans]